MAEYKGTTNSVVKTTYNYFGGRVSLANIADIRSLATRLGIPNDAKITITGGTVEFEYYLKTLDGYEDHIKPWSKR